MKNELKRREFIIKSCQAGVACCALLYSSKLNALGNLNKIRGDEIPDPKKLNYCGYTCSNECEFYKATINNDIELKKKVYADWKIQERYHVEFDPDKIFCYGCKTTDKPEGIAIKNCSVRNCAISKGHDCCIECNELTGCIKELWTNFPDFKNSVIDMQKRYVAANLSK